MRADLLHDAIRTEPSARSLVADADLLRREAAALADIVEDLLHATEVHASPDAAELVDLAGLVDEVVALDLQLALERGVALRAAVAPVAPVRGAFPALRRVVDALVDNALHHAATTVSVRVRDDGREVVLAVGDDGPGIDPVAAGQVFDRFAKDPSPPGLRLGLALVRKVVERHAGTVRVLPSKQGRRSRSGSRRKSARSEPGVQPLARLSAQVPLPPAVRMKRDFPREVRLNP